MKLDVDSVNKAIETLRDRGEWILKCETLAKIENTINENTSTVLPGRPGVIGFINSPRPVYCPFCGKKIEHGVSSKHTIMRVEDDDGDEV